jgi:hypothetical protein
MYYQEKKSGKREGRKEKRETGREGGKEGKEGRKQYPITIFIFTIFCLPS